MTEPNILDWVYSTCRALASDPDAVLVEEGHASRGQYLEIEITPGGQNGRRIVGERGEVIKALRFLAARMTPRPVLLLVLGPEYDATTARVAGGTQGSKES